jgi:molybdopterin-biosynthesis enzyme MoeA-like protein
MLSKLPQGDEFAKKKLQRKFDSRRIAKIEQQKIERGQNQRHRQQKTARTSSNAEIVHNMKTPIL